MGRRESEEENPHHPKAMRKTKKAKEGRTPLPLHVDDNGDILDEDSLLVARPQDRKHARYICLAVNSHDELVEALEQWMLVESEMKSNNPCPDLALRAQYRAKAIELTKSALARAKSTGGEG